VRRSEATHSVSRRAVPGNGTGPFLDPLAIIELIEELLITTQNVVVCSHPLSSMVFGLNALVTKPAISIAPMITVAVLNSYGYSAKPSNIAGVSPSAVTVSDANHTLTTAMFCVTCAVPVITGLLQLVLWQFYTIRDSHKQNHKLTVVT